MERPFNLPKEHVNVMITYKANVLIPDKYYGRQEVQTVRRRAFYCKSDGFFNSNDDFIKTPNGYFSVPQYWENFTFSNGDVALLPHTFYSYGRVYPEDVISWEIDK